MIGRSLNDGLKDFVGKFKALPWKVIVVLLELVQDMNQEVDLNDKLRSTGKVLTWSKTAEKDLLNQGQTSRLYRSHY